MPINLAVIKVSSIHFHGFRTGPSPLGTAPDFTILYDTHEQWAQTAVGP